MACSHSGVVADAAGHHDPIDGHARPLQRPQHVERAERHRIHGRAIDFLPPVPERKAENAAAQVGVAIRRAVPHPVIEHHQAGFFGRKTRCLGDQALVAGGIEAEDLCASQVKMAPAETCPPSTSQRPSISALG